MRFLPLRAMADKSPADRDGGAGLALETRTRTQKPPLYKVMLLNDDYTPMEFVVHVLERFFGLTHSQAFEIAETKVGQVMDFSRRHQHPLQCTMEKE